MNICTCTCREMENVHRAETDNKTVIGDMCRVGSIVLVQIESGLNLNYLLVKDYRSCLGICVNIDSGIPFIKSIYRQIIARNVDILSTGSNLSYNEKWNMALKY